MILDSEALEKKTYVFWREFDNEMIKIPRHQIFVKPQLYWKEFDKKMILDFEALDCL